ncbi:hypothetical protein [Microlunatus endophyticus]
MRAAVTVLFCALVGTLLAGCDTKSSAARSAARTYLDSIASASKPALAKLAQLTATNNPAALRTAGDLLAGATRRITIIDVDAPAPASAPKDIADPVVVENTFADFTKVGVRYRLAGKIYQGSVVLAHPQAQVARDPANWRVVMPLTGSIAWPQPGFLDITTADIYLDGTRIVRTPANNSDDDDATVQPLYPAVYKVQQRLDPYYASAVTSVAVTARSVAPPKQPLLPTSTTRTVLTKQVWAQFAACDTADPVYCPVYALVAHNNPGAGGQGWWLGLTKKPRLKLSNDGKITLSSGTFRYRDHTGTHEMDFDASGTWGLDSDSWKPSVFEIEAEQ